MARRVMRETVRTLVAGAIVYVAMAACSGSDVAHGTGSHAGGGAGVAQAGAGGTADGSDDATGATGGIGGVSGNGGALADSSPDVSGDGSVLDAIADALTDPVADAKADANESGSRLKARRNIADDGAREFVGWYDSQLQVNCAFAMASDGSTRCLPEAVLGGQGTAFYKDSACTQPVAWVRANCQAPKYAIEWILNACTGGSSTIAMSHYLVYAVGAQTTASQLYSKYSGKCSAYTGAPPADTFYALGAETPPTTFVAASEQVDP